tara:strand:- start:186 stop:977 length:792 start_codon:yes stop_codon:yes gene_type:complete
MGKKTKINLNHLKAIMAYPNVSQFENLISNFLDLNEISKNWIQSQNKINSDKSLRFLKTHNMLGKFNNYKFTDNNNTLGAIHIVRDPRNIITSLKNHWSLSTYAETKKFLFNDYQILTLSKQEKKKYEKYETKYPLPQIIGSWKTHYLSWKSLKKNYLLVKYENLIKYPNDEFVKIANFISNLIFYNFSKSEIDTAIELSSFDKLEKMEKEHGFVESSINKEGRKNKFFYLGPKNDWKKILSKNISDEINEKFREEMKELDYL